MKTKNKSVDCIVNHLLDTDAELTEVFLGHGCVGVGLVRMPGCSDKRTIKISRLDIAREVGEVLGVSSKPYMFRDGDVLLHFENAKSLKVLLLAMNALYNRMTKQHLAA